MDSEIFPINFPVVIVCVALATSSSVSACAVPILALDMYEHSYHIDRRALHWTLGSFV